MAKRNHSVCLDDSVWKSAQETGKILGMSASQYIGWLVTQSQSIVAEKAIETAKSLASIRAVSFDEKAAKEYFDSIRVK